MTTIFISYSLMVMITQEKQDLFRRVRSELGGGVRKLEITDETLCDLLENCVSEYAERVQSFVIESNWANLYGKNLSNTDLAWSLSVRTLDITRQYSEWFSKEVGLSQRGTKYELKKDFVELECGKQVYMIPAGREINRVLWITPSTTDAALWGTYGGGLGMGVSGGFGGSMGFGGGTMGVGTWALPMTDVAMLAMDLKEKQSFFKSDLTFKVTAGPNGTHLIHLHSTPGSRFTFGGAFDGLLSLGGCTCWYTYYDVSGGDVDECRRDNINDILLTPDQIPLEKMSFEYLNGPTQNIIRKLLTAKAARTLSFIRGKFSGQLQMMGGANSLTMDYLQYANFADKLEERTIQELEARLDKLSPYKVMENQAAMVENMLRIKKGTPLPIMVI